MRLFRRTLLCLVVSVTAFGAAGWGFRPRASWTVELSGGRSWDFAGEGTEDGPIWLTFDRWLLGGGFNRESFEARDIESGRLLERFTTDGRINFRSRPGGRIATHHPVLVDGRLTETIFETFDTGSANPISKFVFPGDWSFADDVAYAFKEEKTPAGLKLSLANLETGKIEITRTFEGYQVKSDDDWDLSPDARFVAICEQTRKDRRPPFGIDLVDVRTGELQRRVIHPSMTSPMGYLTRPNFLDEPFRLYFRWDEGDEDSARSYWRFRFDDGKVEKYPFEPPVKPPASSPSDQNFLHDYPLEDNNWWITFDGHRTVWFTFEQDGSIKFPWRRFPFEIPESLRDGWNHQVLYVKKPPLDGQVIATFASPKPISYVPETLRNWAPANWKDSQQNVKHYWYNWRADDWRDVGVHSTVFRTRIRARSMLTLSLTDERIPILQSWPLPPRDPKWPALGVAAVCVAGTWWICASRYRRRMRMAA